jgi:sterol desaturase/sphingolipid hydroxylase (fatty acid hydroxylase superfamily)
MPAALLLVTPDMHRVHHSTDNTEANSNFGFNLPWYGTACSAPIARNPRLPQESMKIGVDRPDRRSALREPERHAGDSLRQFRRWLCHRPRPRGKP